LLRADSPSRESYRMSINRFTSLRSQILYRKKPECLIQNSFFFLHHRVGSAQNNYDVMSESLPPQTFCRIVILISGCLFIMWLPFVSVFAFGRSYSVLFLARALQGIGSSCSSVSGQSSCSINTPRI